MEKIKYQSIPFDALIDIKVSGTYYRKVIDLLTQHSETVSQDEFIKIVTKVKDNEPYTTLLEMTIHTLISLIYEIEHSAIEQKKCITVEKDIDNDQSPPVDIKTT